MPPVPPDSDSKLDLNDIQAVLPPERVSRVPDEKTRLGIEALELGKVEVEVGKLRAQLHNYTQAIGQRRAFAPLLFALTCGWLIAVVFILLVQGFSQGGGFFFHSALFNVTLSFQFKLSDPVLLALMGTTTVNVLGLFYLVAKYLFRDSTPEQDRSQGDKPGRA